MAGSAQHSAFRFWPRLLLAGALAATTLHCSGADPTGPSRPPADEPRRESEDLMVMDCVMSPARCQRISDAITTLEQHENAACQSEGGAARDLFNAEGYGYREGSEEAPDEMMYVRMQYNAQYASGYEAVDPNVYVNWSAFELSIPRLAGTVAHENTHHRSQDNPKHTMGYAEAIQAQCEVPA